MIKSCMDRQPDTVAGQGDGSHRQPPIDSAGVPSSENDNRQKKWDGPNIVTYKNPGPDSHIYNRSVVDRQHYYRSSVESYNNNRSSVDSQNYNRSILVSPSYNRSSVDSYKTSTNDSQSNNRSSVDSYNYNRSNADSHNRPNSSSSDKSRAEISDTENDRIIRNPWADVNNNFSCQDDHSVRAGNQENLYDRYTPNAFSSKGPYDRRNWRDESNRRQIQPRRDEPNQRQIQPRGPHIESECHIHNNNRDNSRQYDRQYEYGRNSSENRGSRDPRLKHYEQNENKSEDISRTKPGRNYEQHENRSYDQRHEIPQKQKHAPYQDRKYNQGPPQRYNQGPHPVSERNQDIFYARGNNQRSRDFYRIHRNERVIDNHRANTAEFPHRVNENTRVHVNTTKFPPRVNENERVHVNEKTNTAEFPPRVNEKERVHVNHKANTAEFPPRVNENERVHINQKANTAESSPKLNEHERVHIDQKTNTAEIPRRVNENERVHFNHRANTSSHHWPAQRDHRAVERFQRASNGQKFGHYREDDIKARQKYPIQQDDHRFNEARPDYYVNDRMPYCHGTQVVSNTASLNRPTMHGYLNESPTTDYYAESFNHDKANDGNIEGIIFPLSNVIKNVEQDMLNNNSSDSWEQEIDSLGCSILNLPSVVTDCYSYPSSRVTENHQQKGEKRDNNILDCYSGQSKLCFDMNGNICSNMDNRNYGENISPHTSVYSDMQGKDLNVSQIPLPNCQPIQSIVPPTQTSAKQGEELSEKLENAEMGIPVNKFTTVDQTMDPYHIDENLSCIRQQCFKSDQNTKDVTTIPCISQDENYKDLKNGTGRSLGTDSYKSWDRNKEIHGHDIMYHPAQRQSYASCEAFHTRKDFKTHVPSSETCINRKDISDEMTDFSFLRHPPPPLPLHVASTSSDTVSVTRPPPPHPPKTVTTSNTTPSKMSQLARLEFGQSQPKKYVELRNTETKLQQSKASDYSCMNSNEQTPIISKSSKSQMKKIPEIKETQLNSKAPPLPPHEILKLSEIECQNRSNVLRQQEGINNNNHPSIKDSHSSGALEQNNRKKSEQSSIKESLDNGPVEQNDTSIEPRNYRIPLKSNANSKFRPFRPWTTKKKNKLGNSNVEQRKGHDKTIGSNVEKELNEIDMKKLLTNISSENVLGKQSMKVTKHAGSKRSSMKPKLSQKTESKRKKRKKPSRLRKLLSKSVPYLELLKLSAVAKPRVNTVSSGLTSVVNQNLDPSNVQRKSSISSLGSDETHVAKDTSEVDDANKNHLKTDMEFHKLGLGNKSMLKPHGEQTGARLKKLKSSLNLGSMENLNKIAKGIKQKAIWLEKHKSILEEVNKITKSNGKTNPKRKEHVSGTKTSKKDGKINLSSLHPKMRHKIEKLSAGGPVELDEELITTMPKVSVVMQKCDEYASSGEHGLKIDKAAFMKTLKLLKKKLPAKKFVNLVKRGKFTMPTPTTFIVKPPKVVKPKAHAEICCTDESDVEDESERLDRACEAAKQRLIERQLKTGALPSEHALKRDETLNNNISDGDENKLEKIEMKDNLSVDNERASNVTDTTKSQLPELRSSQDGTNIDQMGLGIPATESDKQKESDEETLDPKPESEEVSEGSPDTSHYITSPDTSVVSSFQKVFSSEMENKCTCTQGFVNSAVTNFTINNLIKSENEKNVNNQSESVLVEAKVYHIEHRCIERRVSITSCPVDGNENSAWSFDQPAVTEMGTENHEHEFCEDSLEWKRDNTDDGGYTEMDTGTPCSKPFIAVPLELPDNQGEHLNLSDTMIDFGLDSMKHEETDKSFISGSQNVLDNDFVQNFQNVKEIPSETYLNKFDENLGESFDSSLNNVSFSVAQQNTYDPMIMGPNIQRENVSVNEENKNKFIGTENQIFEESCKRNFFESIVDDVMHDETLMKNWTAEMPEIENKENAASECKPREVSPVISECSDANEKKTSECENIFENEVLEHEDQNENKVRGPATIEEVVIRLSPFVSLKKLDHLSEAGDVNNSLKEKERKFVSARTPMRMIDFRKKKYVKRFPVPLPRVKNKDHEQEKELYEAAKKFLGDFNDTVKRACRMKREVEKPANVETEKSSEETKQVHEQQVDQLGNFATVSKEHISENKRKVTGLNNENDGKISKSKKIKQEMIQNLPHQDTGINTIEEENLKSPSANKTEASNSDLCYVKSIKRGTKRKIVLKISKASLSQDLHDTENEISENVIKKKIKVENTNKKKKDAKFEDKEKFYKTKKPAVRRELSEKPSPQTDVSRWCVKCNMMFPSQELKKRHQRNDHDVKTLCTVCSVEFSSHTTYRRHLLSLTHLRNVTELQRQSPSVQTKKTSPEQPGTKKSSYSKSETLLRLPKFGKSDDHLKEIEKLLKSPDKLSHAKKAYSEKTEKLLKSPKFQKAKINLKKTEKLPRSPKLNTQKTYKTKEKLLKPPKPRVQKTEKLLKSPKSNAQKTSKETEILQKSPKSNGQKTSSKDAEKLLKSPKSNGQMTSSKDAEKLLKSPKSNAQKSSSKKTEKLLNSPKFGKSNHKQSLAQKTTTKETEKIMKSKCEKFSTCGKVKKAKVKLTKVKKDCVDQINSDNKPKQNRNEPKTDKDLERAFYCSVCEQFYTSNKSLNQHLKTEKHTRAALGPERTKLAPLNIRKAVRKESSSDVNSSIDYSEAEYYQDEVFHTDLGNQTTDDHGFQFPHTYFELSDGEKLRQLALNNPTFLVKNFNPLSQQTYMESQPPETYSYLGLGIDSQQGLKGQGYFQDHPDEFQGDGHLSSSAIGGLVRESYVSLLSSEDEHMDPPYKIYQNLDSADESCSGEEISNKGICEDSDGVKSDVNLNAFEKNVTMQKERPISISSEDVDYTESVFSGTTVPKVTKLKTPPLSPNPICRIKNCYSLAFKGEQRESK